MATVSEQILDFIAENPGATDEELSVALDKRHSHINQECNYLFRIGKIDRHKNENGKFGNYSIISEKTPTRSNCFLEFINCIKSFFRK